MTRRARKSNAKREARKVLANTAHAPGVRKGLAVHPRAIAKALNIKFEERDLNLDTDGLCIIKDGQTTIVVNGRHPKNRKRFTAAHELGHHFLHADAGSVFVDVSGKLTRQFARNVLSSQGTDVQEVEANAFAAELLMPANDVIREWQALDRGWLDADKSVRQLAATFQVSGVAMSYRLKTLDLI